jgi:ubiquinol-cytochrome c reductase cytochrome b subunit
VFQDKRCRNRHSIGGSGGVCGPAFDSVATTMTRDQLVRQVIQGGGNMSAYRKNLNPAEVTTLLETLHSAGRPPARNASQTAMQQTEPTPESSG